MSALTDFLRSQGEELRLSAHQRESMRREWVSAAERLISQMEEWLHAADTDRLLEIERGSTMVSEEAIGAYSVATLRVRLAAREVHVYPSTHAALGPLFRDPQHAGLRARGQVMMTDGARKIYLYRYLLADKEQWMVVDSRDDAPKELDQATFEKVMVNLLG